MTMEKQKLLPIRQAILAAGSLLENVSEDRVRKWVSRGIDGLRLKHKKLGGRIFVSVQDLVNYTKANFPGAYPVPKGKTNINMKTNGKFEGYVHVSEAILDPRLPARPAYPAVRHWMKVGISGRKLCHIRIGARYFVNPDDLAEFMLHLNKPDAQ